MKNSPPTLHDVAALAGVSVATASRALTGISVRKPNQARVQQAADELGYVPNQGARNLRSDRTMTIGVVFNQLNSPLATELLDALADGFEQAGYSLFVATARGDPAKFDQLVTRLLERRVDAVLCVNAIGDGAPLERLRNAGVPVAALFGKQGGYSGLPLIAPSIDRASRAAVRHLMSEGVESVWALKPARDNRTIDAFARVAERAGLKVQRHEFIDGQFDAESFLAQGCVKRAADFVMVGRHSEIQRLLDLSMATDATALSPRSVIAIRDRSMGPTSRFSGRSSGRSSGSPMIYLRPGLVGEAASKLVGRALSEADFQFPTRPVKVEMAVWQAND